MKYVIITLYWINFNFFMKTSTKDFLSLRNFRRVENTTNFVIMAVAKYRLPSDFFDCLLFQSVFLIQGICAKISVHWSVQIAQMSVAIRLSVDTFENLLLTRRNLATVLSTCVYPKTLYEISSNRGSTSPFYQLVLLLKLHALVKMKNFS